MTTIYHRPDLAVQHLEWRYGPSWPLVVTVVDTVRAATPQQYRALAAAKTAARDAAWDAAWDAAKAAAKAAARATAWDAARDAARGRSRAGWEAGWDAARAAAMHDLVGQHGYTPEHEQTLLAPYVAVFGQLWSS